MEKFKLNSLNITFISLSSSGIKKLLARVTFNLNCYPSEQFLVRKSWKIKTSGGNAFFQRVTDLWFKALFIRVQFLKLLRIHRNNVLLQFMLTVPNKADICRFYGLKRIKMKSRYIIFGNIFYAN